MTANADTARYCIHCRVSGGWHGAGCPVLLVNGAWFAS